MSQIRKGDVVTVVRKVEDQYGWDNVWVPPMDADIGRTGKVLDVDPRDGVMVEFPGEQFKIKYSYPTGSLEKVEVKFESTT